MIRTRDKLAAELRKAAAMASPDNAAKYEALAKRAERGEFDDYASTYVFPITQLHDELLGAGFTKFAARVASGEFDATKEESDEWWRSKEGQEAAKHLPPLMRFKLGMEAGPNQLGGGPIENQYAELMEKIARALDEIYVEVNFR